jgi:3-oxo-5-alpha-steroid 4-dehydrogenase 3
LIVFFLASGAQHDAHVHLASLEKYSLPQHPFFRIVLCPHYMAEVLIYAAIAVVAAPQGRVVNATVAAGTAFVAVILGVAAGENKRWYQSKFGEKVRGRWALVPGVY